MFDNLNSPHDLPQRTKVIQSHHFDSTRWNNFAIRDDDIIISTGAKAGTTWMQNIVKELVYLDQVVPESFFDSAVWLDLRVPPLEVIQPVLDSYPGRRQIKTHLRLDALPFYPQAKYIYVGRDMRDCYMSLVNHYRSGSEAWYAALNDTPGISTSIQLGSLFASSLLRLSWSSDSSLQ
jgi:aryl sulfotransferase